MLIDFLNTKILLSLVPLPLGAIIGIAAGGVGVILLIAFIILLLVCVYIAGKKTSESQDIHT